MNCYGYFCLNSIVLRMSFLFGGRIRLGVYLWDFVIIGFWMLCSCLGIRKRNREECIVGVRFYF